MITFFISLFAIGLSITGYFLWRSYKETPEKEDTPTCCTSDPNRIETCCGNPDSTDSRTRINTPTPPAVQPVSSKMNAIETARSKGALRESGTFIDPITGLLILNAVTDRSEARHRSIDDTVERASTPAVEEDRPDPITRAADPEPTRWEPEPEPTRTIESESGARYDADDSGSPSSGADYSSSGADYSSSSFDSGSSSSDSGSSD